MCCHNKFADTDQKLFCNNTHILDCAHEKYTHSLAIDELVQIVCSFCEQFKNKIFHGDVFKHLSIEEDKDLMNVMYVPLMVVQKQTPAAIW